MKIDNSQTKIVFEFSPAKYILVFNQERDEEQWSLNYKIDRSDKGKDFDIGMPVIFLTEEEAETCKKIGFSWTILGAKCQHEWKEVCKASDYHKECQPSCDDEQCVKCKILKSELI